MNFGRLKLRHLQCLVMVAQERSLVRAAQALALTQPAVSKTMAELEEIVGRRLLIRRRRGVELTPAAQVLLRHAAATLRGIREGLDLASGQPEADEFSVVVGALPNVAALLLPQVMAALAQSLPALRVRVASGTNAQLMAQLRQGEVDLVLGRLAEPSDMADLAFEQLYAEPLVLVARRGHPLARARRLDAAALAAHPLVLPVAGTLIRRTVDAFMAAQGTPLPPRLIEATDTSFALGLLMRTDALWFAPLGAAAPYLDGGPLVKLALDSDSTLGPVGLTQRRGAPPTEAALRMIEAIRAATRDHPAAPARARARARAAVAGRA